MKHENKGKVVVLYPKAMLRRVHTRNKTICAQFSDSTGTRLHGFQINLFYLTQSYLGMTRSAHLYPFSWWIVRTKVLKHQDDVIVLRWEIEYFWVQAGCLGSFLCPDRENTPYYTLHIRNLCRMSWYAALQSTNSSCTQLTGSHWRSLWCSWWQLVTLCWRKNEEAAATKSRSYFCFSSLIYTIWNAPGFCTLEWCVESAHVQPLRLHLLLPALTAAVASIWLRHK